MDDRGGADGARWLRLALVLVVVATVLAGCGDEDGDPSGTAATEVFGRPVEREVFELLKDAGASRVEAACLTRVLTKGVNEVSEVFTSERLGEHQTAEDALKDLGGDCLDADRTAPVAAGLERAFQRIAEDAASGAVDQAVSQGSFVEQLVGAGATDGEAQCIVSAIIDIDLWFPAEDFYGEEAGITAGNVFAERASTCGSAERLRELGKTLHANFRGPDSARRTTSSRP